MLKSLSHTGHYLLLVIVSSVFHDLCILGVRNYDIKSQNYEKLKKKFIL